MDCLAEDMALSSTDKTWISKEISKAVRTLDPTGWRKAGRTITAVGTPIAIIAAFLTLSGITIAALVQAFGHLKEETTFRRNGNSSRQNRIYP